MGGGPSKEHESFDVSPTATAVADPFDGLDPSLAGLAGIDDGDEIPEPDQGTDLTGIENFPESLIPDSPLTKIGDTIDKIEAAQAELDDVWDDPDKTLAERYEALSKFADDSVDIMSDAKDSGELDAGELSVLYKEEVSSYAREKLLTLSPDELNQMAFEQGFAHPTLVGLSDPESESPLIYWANPAYSSGPGKDKIQAKADERYMHLASGGTLPGGYTLADLEAAEAGFVSAQASAASTSVPKTTMTPEAFSDLQAAVSALPSDTSNKHYTQHSQLIQGEHMSDALALADQFRTEGPPPGEEAAYAQSIAALQESLAYQTQYGAGSTAFAEHLQKQVDMGTIPAEAFALDKQTLIGWSAGEVPTDKIHADVDKVSADLETIKSHLAASAPWTETKKAFSSASSPDIDISTPAGQKAFAESLKARQHLVDADMLYATGSINSPFSIKSAIGSDNHAHFPGAINAEHFRSWAKDQSVKDLRSVAEELGLPEGSTGKLSKSELQNYILSNSGATLNTFPGGWKKYASVDDLKSTLETKAAGPKISKPATTSTPSSSSGPATAAAASALSASQQQQNAGTAAQKLTTTVTAADSQGWATKVSTGASLMKTHAAAHNDIPQRSSDAEFSAKTFEKSNLPLPGGGSHERWSMTDESGGHWIFKPDKSADGARGTAEAVASKVIASSGVPNVPVHYYDAGSKKGCIQPVVKGASDLSGTAPKAMSQSEVDSVMKGAVSLWMVGDHDAAASNWLRTPGGGIAPCDQGQAFKFVGDDRLSSDYNPNAGYNGASLPNQVIGASSSKSLAPGVKVRPEAVIPVIERFEKMPDSEWRATLRPVAAEGVKSGNVAWVPKMRSAAAARTGKAESAVSNDDVVDSFLDHMSERKKNLRSDFRNYLSEGKVDTTVFDLF